MTLTPPFKNRKESSTGSPPFSSGLGPEDDGADASRMVSYKKKMSNPLPKTYQPSDYEQKTYDAWKQSGFFNPDNLPNAKKRKPYSIAMPPPNATGILHIGHSVMLALQDILVRFERMRGKRTLWLPGTDHAAIATQNVVESELKKEGKTKHDLGRDAFLARVTDYVEKSRGTIKKQIERMGASCDWSRERFTLDDDMTKAVDVAFKTFFDDGLIYRGDRIVNWCTHCQSTLSDDEVEYVEKQTPFYYFRYGPVVIGTARPETKFGDKVIVVHPDDARYSKLVGTTMEVEWILGPVTARVIADESVDPNLGSGVMTITPAHSFIDFELAKKYHIDVLPIINEQGRLTDAAGTLANLTVKEARRKVVEILKKKELVERVDEKYIHNLSVCYRCGTSVEPLVSKQWFIAVDKPTKRLNGKTLKERLLQVADKKEIAFIPERFEKQYRHWIENLHDWCISRQIWYGHRIPAWRKRMANGEWQIEVGGKPKGEDWGQDPDTLDTWFSSGLWTFSTLGWPSSAEAASEGKPKKKDDLATFHPTTVMETGYDILFFWVSRMILMSTYLLGEVPFTTVYLHGLVRDEKGRKMSKSLGNGIDPLEMADKYGADAVRLALVIGTSPGNDQKLSEQKIAGYRNYVNKIWNIGRFLRMADGEWLMANGKKNKPHIKTLADRWVVSRLNTLIKEVTAHLESFEFSQAGEKIYYFAWHEFADWYLEITKIEGNHPLAHEVFGTILKLLHPFMPFLTETLWKELVYNDSLLMIAVWPEVNEKRIEVDAEKDFAHLKDFVSKFRTQRKERGTPSGETLSAELPHGHVAHENRHIIERLARVNFG